MRILLTGANGMLGRDVMAELAATHQVHPFPRQALDVTDPEAIRRAVAQVDAELIINCAAYTDVDGCESHPRDANRLNALAPRYLAVAAERAGAALLHISTDYVFDGTASTPYTEFDPVGPVTAYGRSKLAGEEEIRRHCAHHFILRTAWLYGAHGGNFVDTMLRLSGERDRLSVVVDQVGNPTWTVELVRVIGRLIDTDAYGTYHATAEGEVSWHGLTQTIFRLKGLATEVLPVTSEQFPRPAKRPAYSSLDNLCLGRLGIVMRPWDEALADYLANGPVTAADD